MPTPFARNFPPSLARLLTSGRGLTAAVVLATLFLFILGQLFVLSASRPHDSSHYGDALYSMRIHFAQGMIALVLVGLSSLLQVDRLRRWGPWLALPAFAFALLPFVPGFGIRSGGALRDASLWGFVWQPGPILVVALLVWTAAIFSRRPLGRLRRYGAMLLVSAAMLIAVLQPDFSLIALLLVPVAAQAWRAGIRGKRAVRLVLLLTGLVVLLGVLHPYIGRRVGGWLDPSGTRYDAGRDYVLLEKGTHAGGWTGVGYGRGQHVVRTRNAKDDYLFAHLIEETGLLRAFPVLLLYLPVLLVGIRIGWVARNRFVALLGIGLAGFILTAVGVHVAVNLRLMPVTAIHLPFLSFGGSTLVATALALGLLLSANRTVAQTSPEGPEEDTGNHVALR